MEGPIWLTVFAALGTGIGYTIKALVYPRQSAEEKEPTTLSQVARELRRIADAVDGFASIPAVVKAHGTAIEILEDDHARMRADLSALRRETKEEFTDVRREAGDVHRRLKNVEDGRQ